MLKEILENIVNENSLKGTPIGKVNLGKKYAIIYAINSSINEFEIICNEKYDGTGKKAECDKEKVKSIFEKFKKEICNLKTNDDQFALQNLLKEELEKEGLKLEGKNPVSILLGNLDKIKC